MRLKTVAAGSLVLAAAILATVQVGKQQHTTQSMPRAKHYAANADGRVYAVVQLCWEPRTAVGAPHVVIGPLDRGETNVPAPSCMKPWTRRGLVQAGDRVAVAWVMNAEAQAKVVRWRITINNVQRMGGNDYSQHKLHACIVGQPPC